MFGYAVLIGAIMLGIWTIASLLCLLIIFIGYIRTKWEDRNAHDKQ